MSSQHLAVQAEVAKGLSRIAICQESANECSMGALAQRLCGDGGKPRHYSFFVAPIGRPALAQRIQDVQRDLALTLALEEHPLVAPAGKELTGQLKILEIQNPDVRRRVCDQATQPLHITNVHRYRGGDTQVVASGSNHLAVEVQIPQPPDGRSQVSCRATVGYVSPQSARDLGPPDGAIVQREEGKKMLRSTGNCYVHAIAGEPEAIEQGQPDGGSLLGAQNTALRAVPRASHRVIN